MTELARAVRRPILLILLLAAGALAALLPALLGEPENEHPALRGLAALLIAFLAAALLAARWGRRGPLSPQAHLLELGKVVATVTALLLPALLAGMTTTEVEALASLAQTAIGWRRPVSAGAVALFLLAVAYVASRTKGPVKGKRLPGRWLVVVSVVVCAALVAASAARLFQIPALAGIELLSKVLLLSMLSVLGAAAFLPRGEGGGGRAVDRRALALAVGFVCIGLLSSYGTYRYLRPTAGEIERILFTSGDAEGTTFAAALDGRPDIYALFSLDYASATPRLELVRPLGTYFGFLIEKTWPTRFGRARLEPRPELKNLWSELRPPPVAESFVEVWIRLRWWPWTDFRPGLRIREPVFDWAVSPSWSFAVASTYVRSRDGWPNARYGEMDQGTYAVDVWRRGAQSRRLLDDLPLPPRIIALSEDSVSLQGYGQSYSRGRLRTVDARPAFRRDGTLSREEVWAAGFRFASSAPPSPPILATTTCDLGAWSCEPWKIGPGAAPRAAAPGSRRMVRGPGGWSVMNPEDVGIPFPLPVCKGCSPYSDLAYPLRDGRVVRLSLLGAMPIWNSRLTAFDPEGRQTAQTDLGNVRLTRFAGELDDGTVAIAWRAPYANRAHLEPVFGWTLIAWNPATGARRRLATDLASLPSNENDASMIFLDRDGLLVVPAVDGVRVLTRLGNPLSIN
ncbi:MAG: hypothetical protein KBF21_05480 [Thermoanaerobaculia bacterium]|nr:hypothetical protein [Thermoanaerobaculia bacterium]